MEELGSLSVSVLCPTLYKVGTVYVIGWHPLSERFGCYVPVRKCPHRKHVEANPNKLRDFYNNLSRAVNVPARWELFVMGVFNSKLGKLSPDDIQNGLYLYMGKFGNGTRNENGESLINFIINNDMYMTNTHKSAHVTAFTGTVEDLIYGRRSIKTKDF